MEQKTFPIKGMHCASCALIIKRKLEKLEGVESCSVNYGTEQAHLSFDPQKVQLSEMNHEIGKLGYSLHEGHDMMTPISSDQTVKEQKLKELAKLKRQVQIILPMVFISIVVMTWEIGSETLGIWPKMEEMLMTFFHHLLPMFATYALFVIGVPYLQGMIRFFRYRVANMDSLVGIGTFVAFLYSFIVSAFEEVLAPYVNTQQNYYDVTIVVIGFITLGKFLEVSSKIKTGEAIEKLLGLQAKKALILRDGQEIELSIEEVQLDEIMIVKPGQKIPLDGVILEGKSSIDESMITGESIPVDKGPQDSVIGATINKQGSLQVKVTKIGDDTMLSQIIHMVESAQGSKAPIERIADQISAVFVPVVLVLAIITFLFWLLVFQNLTLALLSFVGILVIACPCAMGLATPTAIIVGVGKAAQHGILIKNAESLEKFNTINFVVMDKTGTLTKGMPAVTDIQAQGSWSEKQILELLLTLEKPSEHPLAQAMVAKAEQENVVPKTISDFSAIEGKGVTGIIDQEVYYAGNLALAKDLGLTIPEDSLHSFTSQGKTPVLLMTKKEIIAYLGIADTVKEEAKETIKTLHSLGIKVAMLTGDNQKTADYIAQQIGIDRVIAEVLPGDKAQEIKNLQHEGYKVAMVGDGINDAPALATADVGIAMGTGTDIAIESAGITLLGGNISKLPKAIQLARVTMKIIKQNLFWAFFYNIVGIPLAAGGLLNPAIAGAAMGLSSVSVVMNSLRLKTHKL